MRDATPDEWSFEDWTVVATALREANHEECLCYECAIDSLLEDIAWHWDLDDRELQEISTPARAIINRARTLIRS